MILCGRVRGLVVRYITCRASRESKAWEGGASGEQGLGEGFWGKQGLRGGAGGGESKTWGQGFRRARLEGRGFEGWGSKALVMVFAPI